MLVGVSLLQRALGGLDGGARGGEVGLAHLEMDHFSPSVSSWRARSRISMTREGVISLIRFGAGGAMVFPAPLGEW